MTTPVNIVISAKDQFSGVFGKLRAEMNATSGLNGRLASSFAAIGPAITGALSVTAVVALARATVNGVDALNDLADATGSSIENLSALEDIAARTGTSMDTVSSAVIRFNKALADARPGNDAAAALDAIGLSAAKLRELDPAEALRLTAVALAGFADDGNKARLVQELFGKSVGQVAPLLKDLAEAGQLNATVTTEQAKAAERFNIELFRLQKGATDVARELSGPLIDAVNQLFDAVQGRGVGGARGISDFLVVPLQTAAVVGANLQFVFRGVGTELGGIAAQARALASGDFAGARTIGQLMREDAAAARKEFDALERRLMSIGTVLPQADYSNEGRQRRPSVGSALAERPRARSSSRATATAFDLVGPVPNQATLDALRALEGTDASRIAALREQLQELVSIRAGSGDKARVDEALRSTVEQLARLDPAAREAAVNAQRLQAILGQTPSGKFAAVLADIDLINDAFARGVISAEQWAQAAQSATSQVACDDVKDELESIGTFAEQAGRNIQDALGSSLEQVLRGNFQSIGDLWRDLTLRMVAQAAAVKLNNALFGSLFGGTGTGSGILGGALSSAFGGFFATGGTLGAGKWGIAGEAGPEVVRGPANIAPMSEVSGGTTVQIINNINGDVSPATVRLVDGAMSRVKADILRSSRTGGAFAGAY